MTWRTYIITEPIECITKMERSELFLIVVLFHQKFFV